MESLTIIALVEPLPRPLVMTAHELPPCSMIRSFLTPCSLMHSDILEAL